MNKFICSAFAAALSFSAYSALAATTAPDDASDLGTKDTAQQADQAAGVASKTGHTGMTHKRTIHHNRADIKAMDTNSDGMISKDEYMAYHEQSYSNMKQTDGMVSTKEMEAEMYKGTTKGNKLLPSDTKTAPAVTN